MEQITFNLAATIRRVTYNGRAYLVAPLTMIVPGILPGSKGPLYYPPRGVAANVAGWDGMPITVYHPTDPITNEHLSANAPGVLARQGVGFVRAPKIGTAERLQALGYFDELRLGKVDRRVLNALLAGQPIELSTGLYTTNKPARNRTYTHVVVGYQPDHLAVLPDQRGACSLADGCGVLVNANPFDTAKEYHAWARKYGSAEERDEAKQLLSKEQGSGGGSCQVGQTAAKTGCAPKQETSSGKATTKSTEFPTIEAAHAFANSEYTKVRSKLTKGEKGSVDAYVSNSDVVNRHLRQGLKDIDDEDERRDFEVMAKETIRDLDSAMAKTAGVLTKAIKVHRGVEDLNYLKGVGVGGVFTDKGYVSTALAKDGIGDSYLKDAVHVEIHVPAGAKGLPTSQAYGHADAYTEFVLPRGSQFRVKSISGNRAVMELVP